MLHLSVIVFLLANGEEPAVPETGTEGDDPLVVRGGVPAPAPGSERTAFLAEAERQLRAAKQTSYSHVTKVDEGAGAFEYDCSGFIVYALSRSVPAVLEAVPAPAGKRPLARDFVKAFGSASARWASVRAEALQPGDLIAWLRPADVDSKNTGHIVVVRGAPTERSPGEWVVPVIDAASTWHGKADSRAPRKASGLGSGAIVVLVRDGAPVGYRWSTWEKSVAHHTTVVMVRLR